VEGITIDKDPEGKAALHYTGVFKLFAHWVADGSLERAFPASVKYLDKTKQLALFFDCAREHGGYGVIAPGPQGLKRVAREGGLDLTGAVLNLDAGFDSTANRKAVFNVGLKPNIKEDPRNRQKPKGGASGFLMLHCIPDASPWNGLLLGRISSSAYCSALRSSRAITSASHLSISAHSVEAKTCNQFYITQSR
jgi:hypothetical protein